MALLDALLLDAAKFGIWVAARPDSHGDGSGTAADPYNGSAQKGSPICISLKRGTVSPYDFEATADTGSIAHDFHDGDVVLVSDAESDPDAWNGVFVIYGTTTYSFKYYMRKRPALSATGSPICQLLTFRFDKVIQEKVPANVRVNLGPGIYQTGGFPPNGSRGWQPKTGQKIVGAGMDVTTLQLVGAENADQHYHVVGMPIEPSGTTAITPLETFEISDLTIDCNVDSQPTRLDRFTPTDVSNLLRSGRIATAAVAGGHGFQNGDFIAISGATGTDASRWNGMFRIGNVQSGSFDYTMSDDLAASPASGTIKALKVIPYPNVACGAVRIFGNHSRVSRVKAINFGTKSFKQGCFVISIIQASGQPTVNGNPVITEKQNNGIQDCIAVQPSKNNARETTVLHIGGLKNSDSHAQGFGLAPFIRRNFVDCQYFTSFDKVNQDVNLQTPKPFSSAFITSKSGTTINQTTNTGSFVGKRLHYRNVLDAGTFVRFYNPKDPLSRWNGYTQIAILTDDSLAVTLGPPTANTSEDNSFVVMGTEFRAIAVSSCVNAVVEQNQIHNCWIGGPYQSPLYDPPPNEEPYPPTLTEEERHDPFNALNLRSLIVRNNFYKNVAVGPYWNMGGVSGAVSALIEYNSDGTVFVSTEHPHKLWVGARIKIESAQDVRYQGIFEVTDIFENENDPYTSYFTYKLPPGLQNLAEGTANYRIVSGVDYLVIEGNQIEVANLDATEFAIKEYPLASSPAAQSYRASGIIVADNGLSALAGAYAHRQVFIHKNIIRYLDAQTLATLPDIGAPVGAAMQLAGVAQLHVTHNVVETNVANPMRTFRCGTVRFFNNKKPNGLIRPGWNWDTNRYYDEPQTLAEEAIILAFLGGKKRL